MRSAVTIRNSRRSGRALLLRSVVVFGTMDCGLILANPQRLQPEPCAILWRGSACGEGFLARCAMEIRDIPGMDGYSVSSTGVVFGKKGHPLKPWLKDGYHAVGLYVDGRCHKCYVARLVLLAFVGPPPSSRHEACHAPDPTRTNNNVENLRWGTRKENNYDHDGRSMSGLAKGKRFASGERNVNSKLTADDVREILRLKGVVPQKELAKRFNVAWSTISQIQLRRMWKHIDEL